jgi:hypothetical protein
LSSKKYDIFTINFWIKMQPFFVTSLLAAGLLFLSHDGKIHRTTFGKKIGFRFSYFIIDFSAVFKKKI